MASKTNQEMSFLDHLEELRWHILRALTAVLLFAVAAFVFKGIVFDEIILAPTRPDFFTNKTLCRLSLKLNLPALCINNQPLTLQNINMAGQFSTHVLIAFITGIIAAFPYVFWEFWRFIKPALYPNELKNARGAIFFASTLFLLGVLFAYFLICPLTIQFLGSYKVSESISNVINLNSYISTISSIILACGIMFELPMLIYFLTKIGLVSSTFLKKYRRHATIIILSVSAIITPPDVLSMIMVWMPIMALYEGSILVAKKVEKTNNP